MLRPLTLTCMLLGLTSCANLNPYVKNYVPVNERASLPVEHPASAEPVLRPGAEPLADLQEMLVEGYDLLGYSAFSAELSSETKAVQQGQATGADVVIYYPAVFQRTATTVVPFQLPTHSTSYSTASATAYNSYGGSANAYASGVTQTYGQQWTAIPIQRDTYFQTASYYVKTKRLVGLIFRSPNTAEVNSLGTQRAAVVSSVVRNSEAYKADILPGDIILSADGLTVDQIPDAEAFARVRLGKTVVLEMVRNGQPLQKKLPIH